jgi:hypothetical protein
MWCLRALLLLLPLVLALLLTLQMLPLVLALLVVVLLAARGMQSWSSCCAVLPRQSHTQQGASSFQAQQLCCWEAWQLGWRPTSLASPSR